MFAIGDIHRISSLLLGSVLPHQFSSCKNFLALKCTRRAGRGTLWQTRDCYRAIHSSFNQSTRRRCNYIRYHTNIPRLHAVIPFIQLFSQLPNIGVSVANLASALAQSPRHGQRPLDLVIAMSLCRCFVFSVRSRHSSHFGFLHCS